jgi:hypothetical protein
VFAGWWHIVQNSKLLLDKDIKTVLGLPYTLSFVIRRRMQINSWMELPEDKRPPESIWDSPSQVEEWFDRVLTGKQTEFNIPVDEIEE